MAGYPKVEVKMGEASESDEEEITVPSIKRQPAKAVVIQGEASESEEEEIMTDGSSPYVPTGLPTTPQQNRRRGGDSPSPQHPNYHSSLLHKKLKERNSLMRKRIVHMARHPYVNAAKDMSVICQQLVKSQVTTQEVGPILRQLTNNLFYLEDKLDITLDCAKLVPMIDINIPATSAARGVFS